MYLINTLSISTTMHMSKSIFFITYFILLMCFNAFSEDIENVNIEDNFISMEKDRLLNDLSYGKDKCSIYKQLASLLIEADTNLSLIYSKEAVRFCIDDPFALKIHGECLLKNNQTSESLTVASQYNVIDNNPYSHLLLARIYKKMNDQNKSKKHYNMVFDFYDDPQKDSRFSEFYSIPGVQFAYFRHNSNDYSDSVILPYRETIELEFIELNTKHNLNLRVLNRMFSIIALNDSNPMLDVGWLPLSQEYPQFTITKYYAGLNEIMKNNYLEGAKLFWEAYKKGGRKEDYLILYFEAKHLANNLSDSYELLIQFSTEYNDNPWFKYYLALYCYENNDNRTAHYYANLAIKMTDELKSSNKFYLYALPDKQNIINIINKYEGAKNLNDKQGQKPK